MKKRLLLGALLFSSFFVANAQDSCEDALEATTGTTYTVSAINGDYEVICAMANEQATAAEWYYYEATETGLLTITSVLDENPAGTTVDDTDTRLTAYTGACGELVCYASNDDQGTTDYRSEVTIPVEAGQTYYFAWDDNWQDAFEFVFELSFEEASCFPVIGGYAMDEATTTEVTLSWTPAIGDPEGYDVLWGPAGFNPETAGTLIEGLTEAEVTISGLTANTDYEFYIMTNCGGGDTSEWVGPITFSTPVEPATVPYESSFEVAPSDDLTGWTLITVSGAAWGLGASDILTPPFDGESFLQVGNAGAASDSWTFSRAIEMEAGQAYAISFYLMRAPLQGEGNVNNLAVTIGNDAAIAAQTTVLGTLNDYTEAEYEEHTYAYMAEETGVHHVGFHYTAPAHTQTNRGVLLLDSFSVDVTAGTNDVLASKFTVFPNPATSVINFTNAENILVSNVAVTDINGRTVKAVNYNGVTEGEINVSDLAAGVYMMTVSSDQGTMTTKIVKN